MEWAVVRPLLIMNRGLTLEHFYKKYIYPDLQSLPVVGELVTIFLTLPTTSEL